ncbi:M48 family metallopeptidase [Kitasatospora sp. NPDC090091]|uniref:M48 family metallopeptidase n=1 Tax=Kitasatospora sp. NPDC090091 TaxID=3364081 RepID=UPI0037F2AFB6
MPNPTATTARPQACPHCTAALDPDPRFTVWCPTCEWNLVPEQEAAEQAAKDTKAAARERAAAERTERLFQEVAAGRADTTRRDWLAASAVATAVHLSTAALAGWGIWLLVTGNTPLRCLGAAVLAVVFLLRPRLGRTPRGTGVLTRAEAPALHGLADRLAEQLGAPKVDVIQVDGEFNASMGVVGLRRTSVLTIGLPLWEAMDDQQRIAMLGHELAHRINGDHRSGLWLGSAIRTLAHWYDLAAPRRRAGGGGVGAMNLLFIFADYISNAVLHVVSWLLLRVLLLLHRLTARAGQQAEYRADELAARAASSEAASGMLTALLLDEAVGTAVLRVRARIHSRPRTTRREPAATPDTDLLWQELRDHLAGLPPLERDRLVRRSRAEGHCVNATHPPTHLRIALLSQRPPVPAAVTATPAESAAIDAELAPHRARMAHTFLAG